LLLVAEVVGEVMAEVIEEAMAEVIEEVIMGEDIMAGEAAFILESTGDPDYILGIGDGLITILQTIITIHPRIIIQLPLQLIPLHPLEMSLSPRLGEARSSSILAKVRARSNRPKTGRSARLGP
jgi:hypothetical protein